MKIFHRKRKGDSGDSESLTEQSKSKNGFKKANKILYSSLIALTIIFITSIGVLSYHEVEKTQKMMAEPSKLELQRLSTEEAKARLEQENLRKQEDENKLLGKLMGGLGLGTAKASNLTGRTNVLLIGVDSRKDELKGRADSLMLFSINHDSGQVDMVTIPRDMYVPIVGKDMKDKINHSFAFGGKDMTIATVESFLNTTIDHYVVFNFHGFVGIVDALGGVEVDVPFDFSEKDSKDRPNAIKLEAGIQTLNGEEALAFARMRKQDPKGDVGRGERQQQVIEAIIDELKSVKSIGTYLDIFSAVKKSTETDVGLTDIPSLVPIIHNVQSVNRISIKGKGTYIQGIYYMIPDEKHVNEVQALLNNQDSLDNDTIVQ